ncbi:MAG: hypothetical protein V4474_04305 [Patescibacteria group bacterium]
MSSTKKWALVLSDSPARRRLCVMLEELGFEVAEAAGIKRAEQYLTHGMLVVVEDQPVPHHPGGGNLLDFLKSLKLPSDRKDTKVISVETESSSREGLTKGADVTRRLGELDMARLADTLRSLKVIE